MARLRMIFIVMMALFFMGTLSSCMLFPPVVIRGAAKFDEHLAQTDLPELAHREDAIDLAYRVGQCLGYKVSLKTDDIVILLHETSEYKEPVTGDYQSTKIFVYKVQPLTLNYAQSKDKDFARIFRKIIPTQYGDPTVHLSVYDGGIYPAGTKGSVNDIMEDFKVRLLILASGSVFDKGH